MSDQDGRGRFALWLSKNRKARGLTQERLSELAEVDQGLISKYERGVLFPPKADTVDRLARAVAADDADEHVVRALMNAGRKAADFAALDDPEYDDEEDVAFLRGLPPSQRERAARLLKAVFAEEDARDNAGNIGKRAE